MKLFTIAIVFVFITSCKIMNIKMADQRQNPSINTDEQDKISSRQIEKVRVNNIGVIISPGLAHSISAVNFFKQLEESSLNIKMISGLGWGAVPASIYASHLKANELDWQFYKLSQTNILKTNLFGSSTSDIDKNKQGSFLNKIFSEKEISSFQVPYICPVLHNGDIKIIDQGKAAKTVNDCALLLAPSSKRVDHELVYREALSQLISYFYKSDINTIVFVTNSYSLNQKLNISDFIMKAYKQNGLENIDNLLISILRLNSSSVQTDYDFKSFKKIISSSYKDLRPELNKLKN